VTKNYKLFGAPLSLYTGKVRSYLSNKQLSFEEVLATAKIFRKVIVPQTSVRFIPVLQTPNGEYLQDTAVIIDRLETMHPERPAIPIAPRQRMVSFLFELFADEWLLLPAMHYRWNHDNVPFIYEEFGSLLMPRMPRWLKVIAGRRLSARFRGFVPMLGITPRTTEVIEQWYEEEVLRLLDQHFAEHDYLLGAAPSLGDYCLMGPLYAHLYRDPAPGRLMREKAPELARWVERMNCPPIEASGRWLADDEIPAILLRLLQRMFREFWPILKSTTESIAGWATEQSPGAEVPRSLGTHEFMLGGITETRVIQSFHQWKLQRVLDCYDSLGLAQRASVDGLLELLGAAEAIPMNLNHRLVRRRNRLVLA